MKSADVLKIRDQLVGLGSAVGIAVELDPSAAHEKVLGFGFEKVEDDVYRLVGGNPDEQVSLEIACFIGSFIEAGLLDATKTGPRKRKRRR